MTEAARRILEELSVVDRLRAERQADAALCARVTAVKSYQARRFERTYADLLGTSRYREAAMYFLDELYGPRDYAPRDAQFARVVPSMVHVFPGAVVETVRALAQLHALSETLDTSMARLLPGTTLDAAGYVRAWQRCGHVDERRRQIGLTLEIGRGLDRYTRSSMFRGLLRMMRAPASAAGLGDLQRVLERGFDAFAHMHGAADFLRWIGERETALASALFSCGEVTAGRSPGGVSVDPSAPAMEMLP